MPNIRMYRKTVRLLRPGGYGAIRWGKSLMWARGIGLASHYLAVYQSKNERSMIEKEYHELVNQQR